MLVVDKSGKALLGMDILRLALERCRTCGEAIDCIDQLLSRYGQAGPAGYRDKNFRYDSSFIIADSDDAWTLPVGIGVSKTIIAGKMPLKFSLQYWHYIETPDTFGPDYQVRFQIAPVVPLPW